jgi:hypothetical protein
VRAYGPTPQVVNQYLAEGTTLSGSRSHPDRPERSAAILETSVVDPSGTAAAALRRDEPFAIEVRLVVREPIPSLDLTVFLHNVRGVRVLEEAWSERVPDDERGVPGEYVLRLVVPPVLAVDEYVAGSGSARATRSSSTPRTSCASASTGATTAGRTGSSSSGCRGRSAA